MTDIDSGAMLYGDEAIDALRAAVSPQEMPTLEDVARHHRLDDLMEQARQTPVSQPKKKKKGDPGRHFNVACPDCKTVMLGSSLRSHRQIKHGIPNGVSYSVENLRQWEVAAPRERAARSSADTQVSEAPAPKKSTRVLDAQELITTVLTTLFPKGMPVDKRLIINRWADATEQFVKDAEL